MERKLKVYISGPISGHDFEAVTEAFAQVERALGSQGYQAVNPIHNGLDRTASWSAHMRADIKLLCDCDMIYMLDGWRQSKGARLEWQIANQLGLRTKN